MIALFTLTTATPAALGLVVGGRFADVRGRRRLIAVRSRRRPLLLVVSFMVDGAPMWLSAFGGGFLGGIAYPAFAVYRTELFPTGNRGRAAGLLTASALIGGSSDPARRRAARRRRRLRRRDRRWSAVGQLVVVVRRADSVPRDRPQELEELNPEDAAPSSTRHPADEVT